MAKTIPKNQKLLDHLQLLEQSLGTPRVPGELDRWIQSVEQEFKKTAQEFRHQVKSQHLPQFEQIGSEDPGLLGRIEEMQAADDENQERCDTLKVQLKRLQPGIEKVGPDEKRLEEHIDAFIELGIEFVTEVRKQETALETWLLEAYNRDRGEGD